jgi:hypothetical protein
MKKTLIIIVSILCFYTMSAQNETVNGELTVNGKTNINTNSDAVLNFSNTDNSWQYIQYIQSGLRKAYLGLDAGNNFILGKENGGNFYFTGGNVGIGVSNPSEKLQVSGDIRLSGELKSGRGIFNSNIDAQIYLTSPDTWSGISFNDVNGGDHLWFNGQHKTFAIGGSGANMANKKLHIHGGTTIGVGYRGKGSPINGLLVEGNVGIGTASPDAKFEVFEGNIKIGDNSNTGYGISFERNGVSIANINTVNARLNIQAQTNGDIELRDDDTNIFLYGKDGGNVGIGTNNPLQKLHISGNFLFENNTELRWKDSGGTQRTVLELDANNDLYLGKSGAGSLVFVNGSSYSEKMRIDPNGSVGIGTTTIPNNYKLAVAGKIIAEEVKVQLQSAWPDYVFKKTYKLPTLKEVEKHIKEKGHLPNIPSAKQVAENGIELGIMNKKLLEKIEELTLYTLQQEKKISELNKYKMLTLKQAKKLKELEEKINYILQKK